MIQTLEDLQLALAQMELHRGDTLSLEAKTFSEYSANALGPTLSAFANLPGGGSILLGVSESDGVSVVGVDDARLTPRGGHGPGAPDAPEVVVVIRRAGDG